MYYGTLFGPEHIGYLILNVIAFYFGLKYIKNYDKAFKILAILQLISIIVCRVTWTIRCIYIVPVESFNWWGLIPTTVCGMNSVILPLCILFGKKNNILLHYLVYSCILFSLITLIYPSFITEEYLLEPDVVSSMLHHSFGMFLSMLLIKSKYFIPDIKKWWVFPVSYIIYMGIGCIEVYVFGLPEGMNITYPLFSILPNITSWWGIGILGTIYVVIFILIYNLITNKKDKKPTK